MKNGSMKTMTGLTILGIVLLLSGILTIVWGGVAFPKALMSIDFLTFLVGGLVVATVGVCLIADMPTSIKLASVIITAAVGAFYVYRLPDIDLVVRLIGIVVVAGLATWISTKLLK